jgi:hypothetical protein
MQQEAFTSAEESYFSAGIRRLVKGFSGYTDDRVKEALLDVYHDSVFIEGKDRETSPTSSAQMPHLLNLGILSLSQITNNSDKRVHYRLQGLPTRYALAAVFFQHDLRDPLLERFLNKLYKKKSGGGEQFERLFARGLQVGSNSYDLSHTWVSLAEMPLFAETAKKDPTLWCYSLRVLTFEKHNPEQFKSWLQSPSSYEKGSFPPELAGPDVAVWSTLIPFAQFSIAAKHALSLKTDSKYRKYIETNSLRSQRLVVVQDKLFEESTLAGKKRDHAVNTTNPELFYDNGSANNYWSGVKNIIPSVAPTCLRVLFVAGHIAASNKILGDVVTHTFGVKDIPKLLNDLRAVFKPPRPPNSESPATSRSNSDAKDEDPGEHHQT